MTSSHRIEFLDTLRGLLIIWVLVVHISLNFGYIQYGKPVHPDSVFMWMSFFMVPFFIISGFFFNDKKSSREFIFHKFKKLIIPYITFTIFGILIWVINNLCTDNTFTLSKILLLFRSGLSTAALSSNTPCWFFFSLFMVNVIYFFIHKKIRKWKGAFLIVCLLGAYLTHNRTQFLGDGNILLGLTYFHVGTIIRKQDDLFKSKTLFIIAFILFLSIGFFVPENLSFVTNLLVQGNYFLNFVFSLSGFIILYYIFSNVPEKFLKYNYFTYIGCYSLILFAYHRPILNFVYEPIIMSIWPTCNYLGFLIIGLFILILGYHVILYFGKRYFPLLIGL